MIDHRGLVSEIRSPRVSLSVEEACTVPRRIRSDVEISGGLPTAIWRLSWSPTKILTCIWAIVKAAMPKAEAKVRGSGDRLWCGYAGMINAKLKCGVA